jgi:hypothetical protein
MQPTLRALFVLAATACANMPNPRSPVGEITDLERAPILLPRPGSAVIAYRHDVRFEGAEHGEPWSEERSGTLYLEPDREGTLHVTYEDDGEELRPLPIDDRSAVDMYFPSSEAEIPPSGAVRAWDVSTMAPLPASPLALTERLLAGSDAQGQLTVTFERAGTLRRWPCVSNKKVTLTSTPTRSATSAWSSRRQPL